MQLLKYVVYLLISLPDCGRSYNEAGAVEDGIKDSNTFAECAI